MTEDVNHPWTEPTIVPRRVQPGDPPGPGYRPPFRVHPCADVLECRAMNFRAADEPSPERCDRCQGPLLRFDR